jgi:hypothetical protein
MIVNRRQFIEQSTGVSMAAAAYGRLPGANDRIREANIGCGRRGLLKELIDLRDDANIEIVAVCDTWRQRREKAAADVKEGAGKQAEQVIHYADILARKDIDAVVIGTPDHQHCTILADAIRAGKDVYVEKPLAMNMKELIRAYDTVKKSDRVVQIGTQMRSHPQSAGARDLLTSGGLGKILKVEQVRNGYSPYWKSYGGKEFTGMELTESDVDWKAFLMNRKRRPFDADILSGLVRIPGILRRAANKPDGAFHRHGSLRHGRKVSHARGGAGRDLPLEGEVRCAGFNRSRARISGGVPGALLHHVREQRGQLCEMVWNPGHFGREKPFAQSALDRHRRGLGRAGPDQGGNADSGRRTRTPHEKLFRLRPDTAGAHRADRCRLRTLGGGHHGRRGVRDRQAHGLRSREEIDPRNVIHRVYRHTSHIPGETRWSLQQLPRNRFPHTRHLRRSRACPALREPGGISRARPCQFSS